MKSALNKDVLEGIWHNLNVGIPQICFFCLQPVFRYVMQQRCRPKADFISVFNQVISSFNPFEQYLQYPISYFIYLFLQ